MKILRPEHFKYLGAFHLERRQGPLRFAGGGHAMCVGPGRTLYVAGHPHTDHVAWVAPPSSVSSAAPAADGVIKHDFFDPSPETFLQRKEHVLDTLGGITTIGSRMYSSWYRFYGVQELKKIDAPTLAWRDLVDEGSFSELRHIGPETGAPFHQKFTSGYMDVIPPGFADGWGEGLLLCGRGDAGGIQGAMGPSVVACNPRNPKEAFSLLWRDRDSRSGDYNAADRWTGMAWIEVGGYGGLLFVGSKGVGGAAWYGRPRHVDGRFDKWKDSKGYHVEEREVQFRVYSLDDLAAVAAGGRWTRSTIAFDPRVRPPKKVWDQQRWKAEEFHESSRVGACCYDPLTRRLYVWESWPPEREGNTYAEGDPRIHVYHVDPPEHEPEDDDPDPEEVENRPIEVTIGAETWTGTVQRKAS